MESAHLRMRIEYRCCLEHCKHRYFTVEGLQNYLRQAVWAQWYSEFAIKTMYRCPQCGGREDPLIGQYSTSAEDDYLVLDPVDENTLALVREVWRVKYGREDTPPTARLYIPRAENSQSRGLQSGNTQSAGNEPGIAEMQRRLFDHVRFEIPQSEGRRFEDPPVEDPQFENPLFGEPEFEDPEVEGKQPEVKEPRKA